MAKPALRAGGDTAGRTQQTLWYLLERTLRILHPFMPFITEEIWQQLGAPGDSIMLAAWPEADSAWREEAAEREMDALMQVVVAARKLRTEQNIPPSQRVKIAVATAAQEIRDVLHADQEALLLLARGEALEFTDDAERPSVGEVVHCFGQPAFVSIAVPLSRAELEAQVPRLKKELDRLQQEEARAAAKLTNEDFLSRAPAPVIEKARAQHAEAQRHREALAGQLAEIERTLG